MNIHIKLADQEFSIKPLPLRIVKELDLLRTQDLPTSAKERETLFFDMYVDSVTAAIKSSNPLFTRDMLLDLPIPLPQLIAAYKRVMEASGLIMGEAKAETPR